MRIIIVIYQFNTREFNETPAVTLRVKIFALLQPKYSTLIKSFIISTVTDLEFLVILNNCTYQVHS